MAAFYFIIYWERLFFNMDLLIISIAALIASLLTFFTGFGLGTILTPVFVIFLPS
ncbi:MAG: hypothetical protein MZV64_32195 [Ignavibacteriales bacterium]|nr:hypothetical protein [Ignavibacteriales bacterium]